jgi:hypothetical protein
MGSKDASDACELFQGGPKVFDRTGGVIFVPNWGASILGTIQPEPIRKVAHRIAAGGFLARFLFWFGAEAEDTDRTPSRHGGAYRQLIKSLSELKPQPPNATQIFKFDKHGIFFREQLHGLCRTIMNLPDTSDSLKAHLNKWQAIFSRLCLVYHMVVSATKGEYPTDTIPSETVEMALTLMINFLLPNTVRFYKEIVDSDDHISSARWIAGHILDRKPTKLSPRDISRAYRELNKNKKVLFATMDILELAGWVEREQNGHRIVWHINPAVHTKFEERAKKEIERRKENRRKLNQNIKNLKEGKW